MPTPFSERLDLSLAWRRTRLDHPDRCFVDHPFLFQWIESDLSGWQSDLARKIDAGYTPHDAVTCYIPKSGSMVRPGAILDLEDEVVFNAILGSFYPQLLETLGWSQGDPDIAYQLATNSTAPSWVKSDFRVWAAWRDKSCDKLNAGSLFVLFTDIAGFYDNVDLGILHSDLNALSVDPDLLSILMRCLNRWSRPRGRGIPQGYSASDLLAKLYLNPVDQGLKNSGFSHLRYVDDIRVFCSSKLEAKRALLRVTDLLRQRGLIPQSNGSGGNANRRCCTHNSASPGSDRGGTQGEPWWRFIRNHSGPYRRFQC
ncbi:MAG: hypothetical protein FJW35_11710 [Acidobacteria bacterium]|nr:hypothetical protein [Acidobacteriota bacterium]